MAGARAGSTSRGQLLSLQSSGLQSQLLAGQGEGVGGEGQGQGFLGQEGAEGVEGSERQQGSGLVCDLLQDPPLAPGLVPAAGGAAGVVAGRGLLALLLLAALLLRLLPALLLGVRGALLLVLGLASNNNEDKLPEEEVQVQVQCFRTEPGPALLQKPAIITITWSPG